VLDLSGLDFFGTAGFSALHTSNVQCAARDVGWALVRTSERSLPAFQREPSFRRGVRSPVYRPQRSADRRNHKPRPPRREPRRRGPGPARLR
jgi:hypothetical protein